MDVLRRNTDYALRAMVHLAGCWDGKPVSTRQIASKEDISYQLACKLMQKLHNAKLIESSMGIAVQGPIKLNRCLSDEYECARRQYCPVQKKLIELQEKMDKYLSGVSLSDLLDGKKMEEKKLKRRKNK
ncbi:MAG: RrF2 family transcriptional regulator [Planctomycetota bacterium]|jgi:DNA-binding IscR family transcriptional regulator